LAVVNEESGYQLNFPSDSAKVQKASGTDEEIGEFEVYAVAFSDSPKLVEDSYVFLFDLVTTNPDAYKVDLGINTYFGGQLEYLAQAEFKDGKVSVYMYNGPYQYNSLANIIENHVLNVDFVVYDAEDNVIEYYENINFMYKEFNRYDVADIASSCWIL